MEPCCFLQHLRRHRRKIYGPRHPSYLGQCQHEKVTGLSMSSYSHLNLSCYYLCHSCLCLIPTTCKITNQTHQLSQYYNEMASHSNINNRPFPTLIFRAIRDEHTEGARSLSKMRWCIVDTPDGLAEMIQTIVSAPNSNDGINDHKTTALYLAYHAPEDLLAIHLHPTDKIFIVDLPGLGGKNALDLRAPFNPAQLLHATTTTSTSMTTAATATANKGSPHHHTNKHDTNTDTDARKTSVLEIGALPSLRGLLESPTLTKVVFNSTDTVRALSAAAAWGVSLRGVRDIQIAEVAGRPMPLFHHRKLATTANADHRGRAATTKLRTLRACLE